MGRAQAENGVDGDDEREEGEEEEEEEGEGEGEGDEEEEEEEEEEPRLKYVRMGGSIGSLLSNDAASCIAVAERMIALGTHDGYVHILDFLGNQVKQFSAHTATVNDLSFDREGEYVGSCADDGYVVINSLFSEEALKFEYRRPMKAIALDPEYSRKTSRRFVAGGLSGNLILNMKKWLGYRDQILHSGEGPIHAIKWKGSLVAWANDAGVKVYDMENDQRITFIERPRGSPRPELLLPHVVWQDDTHLIIGWGTSVKIAAVINGFPGVANGTPRNYSSNMRNVEIVASFQTSYYISGIAPHGGDLVILAYIPEEENEGKEFSSSVPSRQGTAQRPEVRITTWKNDEIAMDALPVHGYEHYKAKDYSLGHFASSAKTYAEGQWVGGEEPIYYIVSPRDVVIAKPRDVVDHINWLANHARQEEALVLIQAGQGQDELLDKVGTSYLEQLISEGRYGKAASLCPKLLRNSASAWEMWVLEFAKLRQLHVLVPYMPMDNPRLHDISYEMALGTLATNPSFHKELLSTIKAWPQGIYNISTVISGIEPKLSSSIVTDALKEALAELYIKNAQHERALALYADLLKPETFDLITKYNLHDAVHDKVVPLVLLDSKRAISLFIEHRFPPSEVISQMMAASEKCNSRYFMHLYLRSLFDSPFAGKEFHDLQVELYAEYEPEMLLPFLRSSQHYNLDKAYEICLKRDLLREQVFLLGRMGNTKKALSVIINKLEDMQEAIDFISMQHDDELWEELVKQCLCKPEMVGVLLEHTVGNLDPLYIVKLVPNGLQIPKLRDRLVKIVTDYRTETSLRHGCNDILKTDCVNLLVKYYKEARHAVYLCSLEDEDRGKKANARDSQEGLDRPMNGAKSLNVKSRTRGGLRCCICFDALSVQSHSAIVFFCCHAYHIPCLADSSSDSVSNSDIEDEDEYEEEASSGVRRMRCILCTTAAK